MGIVAITMLCLLLLSNLETQQMQSQPLHYRQEEEAVAELHHLLDLELPRKIRISEELPARENADEASSSEDDDSPGKEEQNKEMHGNGEWDGGDPVPVDHFTMDYSSIKRRRPIHNMSTQHP